MNLMTLKILNEFGIKPTFNYVAAGADFCIPYFDEDKKEAAFKAFESSYKKTSLDIQNIYNAISAYVKHNHPNESEKNIINIVHLYLGLDSTKINKFDNISDKVNYFVDHYLIFDNNNRPGLDLKLNDAILINSGIRVALIPGTAGIFFNKSGRGNSGFDVRAQVVDEDYTGFVHCSLAYTKDTNSNASKIYCGDKLTQMLIIPVYHPSYEEVSEEEYYVTMANSERGDKAFGSSNEKH